MALSVMPTGRQYYADLGKAVYPPFASGAVIQLSASGGSLSAFTLAGRGITPLDFPAASLPVVRNQALTIHWTAPPSAESTQIFVRLDISHHGGGTARVECNVPDNGTMTIPAGLITQLVDRGTAGFPTLSLTRQTVDSKLIGAGCVDMVVASPVAREVEVAGSMTCNCDADHMAECPTDDARPCPTGQTCRPVGTPNGLTCGS
jgi:hypothetical protein